MGVVEIEAADRRIERMLEPLLLRVEVGNRGAALQVAFAADRTRLQQQRFQQQGFAPTGGTYQRDVADALCRIPHGCSLQACTYGAGLARVLGSHREPAGAKGETTPARGHMHCLTTRPSAFQE